MQSLLSTETSRGRETTVHRSPYVLAVASHKGGTGRTTAALGLAWAWGQTNRRIAFVDADPIRSASLVILGPSGVCTWPNVTAHSGLQAIGRITGRDADIVVIDSPALTDPTAREIMTMIDGIMLSCLCDPLSIRTVPAAAGVIENAKVSNPRMELLGILLNVYNSGDVVQKGMMVRLQESHQELLIEPVIPYQSNLRDWPLRPGEPMPAGPAREACHALTLALDPLVEARGR